MSNPESITVCDADYGKNLIESILREYNAGRNFDLILKTGAEGLNFSCHQVVLAMASDFLRDCISTLTPGTCPVLILPDIKSNVMGYLLFYVYCGEVEVPSELYLDFLDACTLLQLKGPFNYDTQNIMDLSNFDEEVVSMILDMMDDNHVMEMVDVEGPLEDFSFFEQIPDEHLDAENTTETQNEPQKSENEVKMEQNESPKLKIKKKSIASKAKGKGKMSIPLQITPKQADELKSKLHDILKTCYNRLGFRYKREEDRNNLLMEGNKLIQGLHRCYFCEKEVKISYGRARNTVGHPIKFKQWISITITDHLQTHVQD